MSLSDVPPWIAGITPEFFSSAIRAGAQTGLAVAEQNQRANEFASAQADRRAEREAQEAERRSQQEEHQREFEATRLLNVQKIAQDAAQLQQQTAHQTAMESRLLDYDTGRLKAENRRLDLADQQAAAPEVWVPADVTPGGAPGHWALPGGKVSVPPGSLLDPVATANRARVGTESKTASGLSFVWTGPNQIRVMTKDGEQKDMTPGQLQAYAKDAQFSPDPKNKAMALDIERFLGEKAKAQIGRKATNAPTVLAPTALEPKMTSDRMKGSVLRIGVPGQGTRDDPARPQTQEQFDSMRPGTFFINPSDGKTRVKK
jgi:hypothetical protein